MKGIEVGDVVARKSYGCDVLFRVEEIVVQGEEARALLRGLFVRLLADAPLGDLEKKSREEVDASRREFVRKRTEYIRKARSCRHQARASVLARYKGRGGGLDFFEVPGRVLHLEGDKEYRELCLHTYLQLDVPSKVVHVPEKEQPFFVARYLQEERPDILVLTGHDGLLRGARDYRNLESYRHSKYFREAVERAREYEPDRDDLVIIAGGCQSCYEALIAAGANFASAPARVLIHALDPVFIAEKISVTSIYEKISLPELLECTVTGAKGIGGVQTRGKLRLGLPRSRYF